MWSTHGYGATLFEFSIFNFQLLPLLTSSFDDRNIQSFFSILFSLPSTSRSQSSFLVLAICTSSGLDLPLEAITDDWLIGSWLAASSLMFICAKLVPEQDQAMAAGCLVVPTAMSSTWRVASETYSSTADVDAERCPWDGRPHLERESKVTLQRRRMATSDPNGTSLSIQNDRQVRG